MGAIGGLLGLAGGANGSGFAAPTGTNIVSPVTQQQAGQAYTQAQSGLNSQQALLQALQGQNGLGNQSNVYNQLQGVANGTGPNPAQAMLAQSTGQNVANQAALAAGQRGASSNVGLLARQAGQQGMNAQQQAAGQAATLQANQSLGALNSMGSLANTQAANQIGATQGLSSAQQAEQANLLNSIAGVNNANVSMQGNINSNNTSLANQQVQGQQSALNGLFNGASSMSSMLADGGQVEVTPIAATAAPAPVPQESSSGGGGGGNSSGGGLSSLIGLVALMAGGGAVQGGMAGIGAGDVSSDAPTQYAMPSSHGPQSKLGQMLSGSLSAMGGSNPGSSSSQGANVGQGISNFMGSFFGAEGGKVPVRLSPQEKVLSPEKAKEFAKGGSMKGSTVPGKPKVPGKNDYANDTYSTQLKPGSIVIPLESLHTNEDARKFVQATLSKGKK